MTNEPDKQNKNLHSGEPFLLELSKELTRLDAEDARLSLDDQFEPKAGTLLKVEIGMACWRLRPEEFQEIISGLSDGVGSDAIKQAIESNAVHVWHGPAPPSVDTSP